MIFTYLIFTYLTKVLALKLQKRQTLVAKALGETKAIEESEVDCAYLWGIVDALMALGLSPSDYSNLTWLRRLYCRPSQIKDLTKKINLTSHPTSEEAREMRDVVLKVNLNPAGAND